MFKHIYVTRIKYYLRNKEFIFWLFIFPVILTTLFRIAFGDVMKGEVFKVIDIAIVKEEDSSYANKDVFVEVMDSLAKNSEDQIFEIKYTDEKEARQLLEDEKISAYIKISEEPEMVILENGISQTIVKEVTDVVVKKISLASEIYMQTGTIPEIVMNETKEYIIKHEYSENEPNSIVTYFFSALAMTCLLGATLGLYEILNIQANLSPIAMRNSLAPVPKGLQFVAGFSSACTTMFVMIMILIAYIKYVLGIEFGDRTGFVILTSFVGSVTGVALGMLLGIIVKKGEETKNGIITSVTLFLSFLAGLMFHTMKYLVHEYAPIIDWINPVARITDAYYVLYYYKDLSKFFASMIILMIMTVISIICTLLILRRQKYDSI